jgi:hypothetical protein
MFPIAGMKKPAMPNAALTKPVTRYHLPDADTNVDVLLKGYEGLTKAVGGDEFGDDCGFGERLPC